MSNCCGFVSHKKRMAPGSSFFKICEISSVLPNKTGKGLSRFIGAKFQTKKKKKTGLRTLYTGYCHKEIVGQVDMNYFPYKYETSNNKQH